MLSGKSFAQRGWVDRRGPVNWRHPLNRGRMIWWLPLYNQTGGGTVRDITRQHGKTYDGTLGNISASAGWPVAIAPPGAVGPAISFTAASSNVAGPTFAAPTNGLTVAAWVYQTTSTGTQYIASQSSTSTSVAWRFSLTGAQIGISIFNGSSTFISRTYATGLPQNAWHRVVATWGGGTTNSSLAIYMDGQLLTTSGGSGGTFAGISTTAIQMYWGCIFNFGVSGSFLGYMDDFSLWNRAFAASEVFLDWNLGRCGYPGVLNRMASQFPLFGKPASGGAIVVPWNLFSQVACGQGVA